MINHGDQKRSRDHPPLDSSGYPHERDNGLGFSRGADGRKAARPRSVRRRAETFGVGSFTFRACRPFHPPRLMAFVMEYLPSVLRSKVRGVRHLTHGVSRQYIVHVLFIIPFQIHRTSNLLIVYSISEAFLRPRGVHATCVFTPPNHTVYSMYM